MCKCIQCRRLYKISKFICALVSVCVSVYIVAHMDPLHGLTLTAIVGISFYFHSSHARCIYFVFPPVSMATTRKHTRKGNALNRIPNFTARLPRTKHAKNNMQYSTFKWTLRMVKFDIFLFIDKMDVLPFEHVDIISSNWTYVNSFQT